MRVYKGNVITVNKNNDIVKYLVEDGGKIAYVGNDLPVEYAKAETVDFGECALMPSFADGHGHFASYAMLAKTVRLDKAKSNVEVLEIMKKADLELPKKKTMLCFGASPKVAEGELISKGEIDAVVPNRKVVVICGDGHSAVMNSVADKKMPSVVKEQPGYNAENGWFMHQSFYKAVDKILNVVSASDALQAFQDALDVYAENGFGLLCCESGTGFPLDLDISLLTWLYRGQTNGQQVRIFIQSHDPEKALKRGIPRLGGCFKCALDGSITSSDAAFIDAYCDDENNHGILYYTDEELYEKVEKIHLAGLAFQCHAIGDAAVLQAARTFKKVLDNHPKADHRLGIIHATLVPDEAMDIIEKYHITVIDQPGFLALIEQNYEFMIGKLGEKRGYAAMPYDEFMKRGIVLAASSDCPVSFPDGIEWLNWLVNNLNVKHRISLTDAIRVCTYNAYYATFDEDMRGSLEKGKVADMIILDRNPYAVKPEEIGGLKVTSTILAGKKWESDGKRVLGVLLKGMVSGKNKKL